MKLNSSAILPAAGLLLLLSPTATDAFTIPTVLHITKARHPSRVQVAATHGVPVPVMMATAALDRAFDSRMGGLARLLDEMTTDPFWKTAPAPSLFKRLDTPAAAALGSVKVDVKETATAYEISADLPGVKKEDIKLSFSDAGALTIEAERREHWEEALPPAAVESAGAGVDGAVEGAEQQQQQLLKYHFKETTYGKVARSFKLPQNADSANVEATLSDGVLRVTIPKREAPAARTFEIK